MSVRLRKLHRTAEEPSHYFFNNIPFIRAIRLTDPAWRPNSAAIFDAPTPCLASVTNRRTSCPAHSFGFGVFMVALDVRKSQRV